MKVTELKNNPDETIRALSEAVTILYQACSSISGAIQMIYVHPKIAVNIADAALKKVKALDIEVEP